MNDGHERALRVFVGVRVLQAHRHVANRSDDEPERQRLGALVREIDQLFDRRALNQLDDENDVFAGDLEIEHLRDVGVRELRGELGLVDEHLQRVVVFAMVREDPLEHDGPKRERAGEWEAQEDLGHAADRDAAEHLVLAEPSPGELVGDEGHGPPSNLSGAASKTGRKRRRPPAHARRGFLRNASASSPSSSALPDVEHPHFAGVFIGGGGGMTAPGHMTCSELEQPASGVSVVGGNVEHSAGKKAVQIVHTPESRGHAGTPLTRSQLSTGVNVVEPAVARPDSEAVDLQQASRMRKDDRRRG